MSLKLDNIVVSFLIFSVLTVLVVNIHDGVLEGYDLNRTHIDSDGEDVMTKLKSVNFFEGVESFVLAMHKLSAPTASKADVLGGLAAAAIGILKIGTGVISLPVEILGIITGFYYVPPEFATGLSVVFIIYIGFLLVQASRVGGPG